MKSLSSLWKDERLLLVSFAIFQTIAVGGIMYGWAGVAGTLLVASTDKGGAGLTLNETMTIFAMVASISSFSPLLLGIVLDQYGPRISSLLSNIIVGIGIQTIASAKTFSTVAVGACTVAFGGPGIQSSVVSFANLFPSNPFFVLSIVNGSISLSFAILPIFGIIWERYGIGYQALFQSYLLVVVVSGVGAFLFMPDEPYPDVSHEHDDLLLQQSNDDTSPLAKLPSVQIYNPSPEELILESTQHFNHLVEQPLCSYLREDPRHALERHESFLLSKKAIEKGQLGLVSLKDLPFTQQVTSGSYMRILIVFCVTSFFANFYIATITTELADYGNEYSVDQQQAMTKTFSIILSFGILGSFLAGSLMDTMGLETCTLMTLLFGILHMITLILLGTLPFMTFGFVIYTLFRQFLFPVFIASLSAKLGFKYFGMLSGIGFAMSGMLQLCMAPLAQVVQGTCHVLPMEACSEGYWKELHVIQIVIFAMLGLFPLWDHCVQLQRHEYMLERIQSQTSLSSSAYGSMEV